MASSLPSTHQALVLESTPSNFTVKEISTPKPHHGSTVIRILAAGVLSYHREIYNGDRSYPYPVPLVPGMSAIGRVAAIGPDATTLKEGDLVYADCVIHGRDDPDNVFLTAIHEGLTEGSKKLMKDVWRHGSFAEFQVVPLENCFKLDETRLCRQLGYTVEELTYMSYLMVPFGGLRDIKLEPGETVVVAPATGGYGGAGVMVAVAMGARVVAMGRNEEELARLKSFVLKGSPGAAIETIKMTGDEMKDAEALKKFGTIDTVLDFSPPQAANSSHVRSAVWALRRGGRVSLMGNNENPMVPVVLARNISLHGKLMYEREEVVLFVKMLERGLFPKSENFVDVKAFQLKDWKEGLDAGAEHMGIGKFVVFTP